MRFGVFSYWDNSYWQATLAATGGALVLGALPRIMRSQQPRHAVVLALGIGMLANSRPYEGMIFCIAPLIALLVWACGKNRPPVAVVMRRVAFPLAAVLCVAAACTGYYFWRVTGSTFVMPQELNRQQYAVAQYFFWQRPNTQIVYRHQAIADFYLKNELPRFLRARSVSGFFLETFRKIGLIWVFFIGPLFTIPLLFVPKIWQNQRVRLLVITGIVSFTGVALVIFFDPHYAAPMTAVIVAAIVLGMQRLRAFEWENRPLGLFLVRAIVFICIAILPLEFRAMMTPVKPGSWPALGTDRDLVNAKLSSMPQAQIVLVRYAPDHDPLYEWVYNAADIDNSKVVWARDMGPAENEELLRYYKDRRAWLLEPDQTPPALSPYPGNRAAEHESGTD